MHWIGSALAQYSAWIKIWHTFVGGLEDVGDILGDKSGEDESIGDTEDLFTGVLEFGEWPYFTD